ncbi:2Fe-2S iron-sulfur cluster-binding protein [Nannocystis pusilla]|uniref:2Fe-2S iron-sulfur cluster-binding protein n=1 Tax=Nannocystis pusilla TaxID=889268 RepID=UPI003DA2D9FC
MHRLSVAEIEAVVGKPMPAVLMKQIDALDEGCRRVLTRSPLAGFGYRDEAGSPRSTFVGGRPGFVRVDSAKRVVIEVGAEVAPMRGSGASFVFMLPGVGDTLRLNGAVEERRDGSLVIAVAEAFVHCPKCILRSGLWQPPRPRRTAPLTSGDGAPVTRAVAEFLASAPFAVVSTWDAAGASDTSPRGDPAGFIKILDGHTLAIPDRRGNQRIDTFHNLMTCDQISLAAVVPGRQEVLHVHGTAWVTDEPAILASMALKGKPPHLALCVRVLGAELVVSEAIRAAKPWQPSSHVNRADVPDLVKLAAQHLARNRDRGVKAALLRSLARIIGPLSAPLRRLIDKALRSDLAKEGYEDPRPGLGSRRVRVAEIRRETADAVTLLLEDGAPFDFRAGQYFTLCVEIDGETVRRAYSASSMPGDTRLALTIKRVTGGRCSSHVNERVRVGDALEIIGPSGTFAVSVDPSTRRELVLVAGGSGITPIVSIARTVLAHEPGSRVVLLYGNRGAQDIIFAEALEQLRSDHAERLQVRHVLQHPPEDWAGGRGLLDEATLRGELGRIAPSSAAHYFVCGPEPMLLGARRALAALGVEARRIHEERFSPPRRSPASKRTVRRRLPLLVEQSGQRIGATEVAPGKTLLEAGLAAGLPMPFSCAMGNCGECRVRLKSGEVELDEPNSLSAEERGQGYVLACVARPLTATTVEIEEEDLE